MNIKRYFFFIVLLVAFFVVLSSLYLKELPNQFFDDSHPSNSLNEQSSDHTEKQTLTALKALINQYDNTLQYENPAIKKHATVSTETLNIRSQPSTNWESTVLTTATLGEQLEIVGERSSWYQVSYHDTRGWVSKSFVTPTISLITTTGSLLQLHFTDYNTINLMADVPINTVLTNHENGKYTIHFENILFVNARFDLDHPDIPVFKTFSNQLEIYTLGWFHSSLAKHSDSMYSVNFTPTVYGISHVDKENRDQVNFITSGRPTYQFVINENRLVVTFTEDVEFATNLENDLNRLLALSNVHSIQKLQLNSQEIIVESIEPMTWKVYADSHSLTIDISGRGLEGKRIVIDPGHGGSELGTYGRQSGIREKELNLDISLLLKKALENLGAVVYMTRDDDTTIYQGANYETSKDLLQRVTIAKDYDADFFISIHADNFPADLSVNGTASYYFGGHPHSFQSESLAELIGSRVAKSIGTKWLGVHDRPFAVVRHNPFPAILLELGFLSNKLDETKLIDPVYQQKMVDAISKALVDFYQ